MGRGQNSGRWIWGILCLGAVLRILACSAQPFLDERFLLRDVHAFLTTGRLVPVRSMYPTFYADLAATAMSVFLPAYRALGVIHEARDIIAFDQLQAIAGVLPGRLVSLVASLLSLAVVARTGERFFGAGAGVWAAAILALSPMHIAYGGMALPEATLLLCTALCLHFSVAAAQGGGAGRLRLAAGCGGLALATKYNALTLWCVPLAVGLKSARRGSGLRVAGILGLLGMAAFLVGSPSWLIDPGEMWRRLVFSADHVRTGHPGRFGPAFAVMCRELWGDLFLLVPVVALGVGRGLVTKKVAERLLAVFVVVTFAYVGTRTNQSLHYAFPMYAAGALLTGSLLASAWRDLSPGWMTAARAAVICILAVQAYRAGTGVLAEIGQDNRRAAETWLAAHVAPNVPIAVDWEYVPVVLGDADKAALQERVSGPFFRDHVAARPSFRRVGFRYDDPRLSQADVFITSDACFERFRTTPPPPEGNPQRAIFLAKQAFYQRLLGGGDSAWHVATEFGDGAGPRVVVLRRRSG